MNEWKVGAVSAVAAPAQWWWWLYVCLWLKELNISHCHRKKRETASFSMHWNRRGNKGLHTGSKLCAWNVWQQHWGQEHSTYNTLNTMVLSTKGNRRTDLFGWGVSVKWAKVKDEQEWPDRPKTTPGEKMSRSKWMALVWKESHSS